MFPIVVCSYISLFLSNIHYVLLDLLLVNQALRCWKMPNIQRKSLTNVILLVIQFDYTYHHLWPSVKFQIIGCINCLHVSALFGTPLAIKYDLYSRFKFLTEDWQTVDTHKELLCTLTSPTKDSSFNVDYICDSSLSLPPSLPALQAAPQCANGYMLYSNNVAVLVLVTEDTELNRACLLPVWTAICLHDILGTFCAVKLISGGHEGWSSEPLSMMFGTTEPISGACRRGPVNSDPARIRPILAYYVIPHQMLAGLEFRSRDRRLERLVSGHRPLFGLCALGEVLYRGLPPNARKPNSGLWTWDYGAI